MIIRKEITVKELLNKLAGLSDDTILTLEVYGDGDIDATLESNDRIILSTEEIYQ